MGLLKSDFLILCMFSQDVSSLGILYLVMD